MNRKLWLSLLAASLLGGTLKYSYDEAGRLTKVDYGDGRAIAYTYDKSGNLVRRERTGLAGAPAESQPSPRILPLSFEMNRGQMDPRYQFLARSGRFSVAVSSQEALLTLPGAQGGAAGAVRLEWIGANGSAKARGQEAKQAVTNYLTGRDPEKWITGVPHYSSVRYSGVYPGIDLIYYGNPKQFEYDFVVAPGADPSAIRFRVAGAKSVAVESGGDLVAEAAGQVVRFRKPDLYQQAGGSRRAVPGSYQVVNGVVGFRVGRFDPALPLVIDPVFQDYTLMGGSGDDIPTAVAEDSRGNIYIAGTTNSTDLPGVLRAVQGGIAGATDIFVMKLNRDGKSLAFVTYLGGSMGDAGGGIAVDAQGMITITGTTASRDFPMTGDALQPVYGGGASDAVVARLNPNGSRLLYSTYLGGSADDSSRTVAVDAAGAVYAAGTTNSANFPTRTGALQARNNGGTDGFVLKLVPGEAQAAYATYLGGSAADGINAVAVDASGSAHVAGGTASTNFPTTGGVLAASAPGGTAGFLAKLNPAGGSLVYSTYVGGSGEDEVLGLALGSDRSAFVSGVTSSRNLPAGGNVFERGYLGGASDGFLMQIAADGARVLSFSYLGGQGADRSDAIAVRREGTILVAVNGTSFAGEPARMYAFPPDLSVDFGSQTIDPGCLGGEGRIVALSHNENRSMAVGWGKPSANCRAPQRFASSDGGVGKEEAQRAASVLREAGGGTDLYTAFSGSSPSRPDPSPLPPIRPAAQYRSSGSAGDPFSTSTGEQSDVVTDLDLGGVIPVAFRRYYSSAFLGNEVLSGLGANWSHNFDLSLNAAFGTAVATLEGGARVTFRVVSGGWQMQQPQNSSYQMIETPSSFELADINGNRVLHFNLRGQLIRIEDRNGNMLRVTPAPNGPAEVSDGVGRSLKFTYSGGFLTEVRDHAGRTVKFAYRGENLVSATDPTDRVTRYEYTAAGPRGALLTRHVHPAGNAAFVNRYDAGARVVEQADGDGQATRVGYESGATPTTSVTEPLGAVTRHVHDADGKLARVTDATGSAVEMTYDSSHRRTGIKDRQGNTTAMSYHAPTGRVESVTDALGNKTTTTFAGQAYRLFTFYNVTKVTLPDGKSVSYEYDARGNPVSITDRNGLAWKYTYNAQGLPLTLTSPSNAVTRWTYHADGTVATRTTPAGDTTSYARDPLGRITTITHPDGTTRKFSYDNRDRLTAQTDETGKAELYAYDQNNQFTSKTDRRGVTESIAYTPGGRPAEFADRAGNKTVMTYNRNGLTASVTDAAGGKTEMTYDSLNRLSSVKDAIGARFQMGYDKEGGVLSAADGLGRTWRFQNDRMGRVAKATSPLGNASEISYDNLGRVSARTDALGQKTEYSYDGAGQVTGVRGPGGLGTAMTRNENGSILDFTDAGGAVWRSRYDAAGRLEARVDPLERVTGFTYDSRGRIAKVTLPGELGSASYIYDAVGRLITTRFSDESELKFTRDENGRTVEANGLTLGYDPNGRVIRSNGLLVERDKLGRIAAVTYAADKTVRYGYDVRGQVVKVTDWLNGETAFTYDAAGALTEVRRPNGAVTRYQYGGDGRLASIEESAGGGAAGGMRYTYDAAGRIVSEERSLPAAADPKTGGDEFSYDAAAQLGGEARYDALGRLTSDGKRTYSWDLSSRLKSFSAGESTVSFAYDARGQMISRTRDGATKSYVVNYATAHPVISAERSGEADQRYYVHLPDGRLLYSIDAATGARRFYHFDQIGSTTLLTGDDGAVTDSYEITPYGEVVAQTGSTDNPFTFLGADGVMQQDRAGLYLMRFRFYDAGPARFLTRDPVNNVTPRGANPYQYGLANPVLYSDPKGLSASVREKTLWDYLVEALIESMNDPATYKLWEREQLRQREEERRQREEEELRRREAEEFDRWYRAQLAFARTKEEALAMDRGGQWSCVVNTSTRHLDCIETSPPRARTEVAQNPLLTGPLSPFPSLVPPSSSLLNPDRVPTVDGGGTLVGDGGGTLVGDGGGTLVGNDGATLIGHDGATLIGNDGATVVGNDGAGLTGARR